MTKIGATTRKKNSNTNIAPIPEFTSSDPTANSTPFEDVVAFGQKLVEELKLEPDTLGRWMAHYIAEVILKAETAEGEVKVFAERECFGLILQLWKHRASLPGQSPLHSFDPIFKVLEALQEPTHLWYFDQKPKADGEVGEWLELAENVDYSARLIIRFLIAFAATEAAKTESKWLETGLAGNFEDGEDIRAARMLVQDVAVRINLEEEVTEQQTDELVDIRNRLDGLVSLSRRMRDMINGVLGEKARKTKRKMVTPDTRQ